MIPFSKMSKINLKNRMVKIFRVYLVLSYKLRQVNLVYTTTHSPEENKKAVFTTAFKASTSAKTQRK